MLTALCAGIEEVDRLLLELERNGESAKLSFKRTTTFSTAVHKSIINNCTELENVLSELKAHGRNVEAAGPIFTKRVSVTTGKLSHITAC